MNTDKNESSAGRTINVVPTYAKRENDHEPAREGDFVLYECPNCNHVLGSGFYYPPINNPVAENHYCPNCGTKLNYDVLAQKTDDAVVSDDKYQLSEHDIDVVMQAIIDSPVDTSNELQDAVYDALKASIQK